ncbi:MAG: MBL fold metallo-hydrolase [Candidatus Hodarchaeales archaeon]|jgi:ribonuclease J
MYLTPYGGVNEIGGNCFLLESEESRILLDFGRSFKQESIYFAGYLQPRTSQGLKDFFEFDTLPRIQGLYDDSFNVDFGRERQIIDGVFLSHAHMDHYGNLNLLHESIPIHMGETAKLIIQSIQETSRPRFGRDFIRPASKERPSNIRTFRTGDCIQISNLNIFPVHVDHSIPGSYGFIVENRKDDYVIAYSGDIRLHGWRKDLTRDFIKLACEKNVNTLLMEGTNVSEDFEMNEEKVQKDVSEAIGNTDGLAIANYSLRDIDRFRSFYFSAKENSRKLLINFKQAHLLKTLQSDKNLDIPPLEDPTIEVYRRPKSRYYKWEQEILDNSEFSIIDSPNFNQEEYVFHCDFWNFTDLIDIQPHDASYFYSHGDPFSEEGIIDFNRMKEWVRKFKLKFYQFHASGHAPQSELKRIVESIAPEVVIPIHSEEPEKYKNLIDLPILLPSRGHKIILGN